MLRRGAAAILPQHLPDRWLDALLEEAEVLQQGDPGRVDDTCAGLLSAVLVLYAQQAGHPEQMDIAATTLLRYMSYYIVALSAESVSRHTAIWVDPPTLAHIFDAEREMWAMRRAADGA